MISQKFVTVDAQTFSDSLQNQSHNYEISYLNKHQKEIPTLESYKSFVLQYY